MNPTVSCVWFTSKDPDTFSTGLEKSDSKEKTIELLKLSNQLNLTFYDLKYKNKETAIVWSGNVNGAAFGTFTGAKVSFASLFYLFLRLFSILFLSRLQYRLGTELTQVKLDVFKDASSMFGGIAHPIVKTLREGVAVSISPSVLPILLT
jgi:hypothetical protein